MSGYIRDMDFAKMKLDKTMLNGVVKFGKDGEHKLYADIKADNINFDNYVLPVPENVKTAGWEEIIKYVAANNPEGRNFDADITSKPLGGTLSSAFCTRYGAGIFIISQPVNFEEPT